MVGKKLTAIVLVAALAAASCGEGTGEAKKVDDIVLTSGLERAESCDSLLLSIQKQASAHVGPYGIEGPNFSGGGDVITLDGMEADFAEESASADTADVGTVARSAAPTAAPQGESAEKTFTGTNNQEVNVDEADFVKTDGNRILVLQDSTLFIIDAATKTLENEIELEYNYGTEMFIDGDKALLMGSVSNQGDIDATIRFEDGPAATSDFYEPSSDTKFVQIDLASGNIEDSYELPGRYITARLVDGSVRIVQSHSENRLGFVYPSGGSDKALETAEKANKALVDDSVIGDWLPTDDGGNSVVECEDVYLPQEFSGFGLVVITTLEFGSDIDETSSAAVFTQSQDVYASTNRLVVSTPKWTEPGRISRALGNFDTNYSTALHTFDITDPNAIGYVASGQVTGTLLSRYSLSEHNGYLRVATTEGSPWSRNGSESLVTVLEEKGGALVKVGQVDDIGRGEAITSARFFGDVAYVVTFRQTDPFYTVDLSDPANPTVLGELKIPGFSSYLHPLDENRVLAVGTDGDDDGATGYPVASMFDVSDLSNPKLVDKIRLSNEQWAHATPSDDPRSFQIWENTALIPVQAESEGGNNGGLVLVEIDNTDIDIAGKISHPQGAQICENFGDFEITPEMEEAIEQELAAQGDEAPSIEPAPPISDFDTRLPGRECWTEGSHITRSLVIDGEIFSVSNTGVLATDSSDLTDIKWIPFK